MSLLTLVVALAAVLLIVVGIIALVATERNKR